MQRPLLVIMLHLFISQSISQDAIHFLPPLDIPLVLSGNFGEIRDDHFHSGIDIKTNGVIGYAVHSIEEGYVSRIKVQANGYGKSIYVSHPTGHTSQYGHLDRYTPDIASHVKQIQYARKSHVVDIYLKPGQFPLQKGAIIGYSGNSGSSSGPHLHLEIRTTGDQHPTNVLRYGFDITDRLPPRFHQLFLYPVGDSSRVNRSPQKFSAATVPGEGGFTLSSGPEIAACGTIGCGVEVFDYLNGAPNRCGVYMLELFVNGSRVYKHVMDEFSFSETRFINAHIDYGERFNKGTKSHRLHRLPNDRLRIYRGLVSDGLIQIEEGRTYEIRVVASDVAGNNAELKFRIRGEQNGQISGHSEDDHVHRMSYHKINRFSADGVELEMPAYALYDDLDFRYASSPRPDGLHSELHHVHTPDIPVHLPYRLSINTVNGHRGQGDRLCLVTFDKNGEISYVGGEYKDGKVTAQVRSFGTFAVSMDTIPPEIIPYAGKAMEDPGGTESLRFIIRDDLSGIDRYEGYIDNRWALFEYDPKDELLTYIFDNERIERGSTHELELYVTDASGNVNLYHSTFKW
ncbi:MAG TPA: M23 family metallopeptidase [Bacteroides sp.]|nr:M23 family metallopeptidase [Bacteroides sp.]